MSPRRWAAAGALVSLALALAVFELYMFTGGDNAAYYALAQALATGRGYVDLITPGAPPATQYPPGFPLLLVPVMWIFGGAYVPLKIVSFLAGAGALAGLWALARREDSLSAWGAPAAVWLLGLYPVFRIYTHWVLSDMAYVAMSLAALAVFARAAREAPASRHEGAGKGRKKKEKKAESEERRRGTDDPWGPWLVGALLALAAFYIRTAGVALLAAPFLWALWRRSWRRAGIMGAIALVGAAPWFAWVQQRPIAERGSYLRQLTSENRLDPTSRSVAVGEIVERGIENTGRYASRDLPQMVWPLVVPPAEGAWKPAPLPVRVFGGLFLGALIAYGVALALRKRGLAVWDLYAALSLGVILVWAWTGDRFFLTVVPFLWIYFLIGLDNASRLMLKSARPAVAVVALIAAVQIVGAMREVPSQLRLTRMWLEGEELAGYHEFWQDYFEAARWIGEQAPHAVIVARKPTLAWYWSGGRPSYAYPFHREPDATWEAIREGGATHILLEYNSRVFLAPTLERHVEEFEIVHSSPRRLTVVLAIRPESP